MKYRLRWSFLLALGLALVQSSDSASRQPRSPNNIKLLTSCALKAIPESALHHHQAAAPNVRVRESRGRAGESTRYSSSQNWCGYAVETDFGSPQNYAVSSVVGQWTIPGLTASTSANTYSSIWIGMDGYSSGTVEQIGTEQDWTSGSQQNYVWFEMYPKSAYEIVGFPIAPGEKFGAGVSFIGSTFVLSVTNFTQGVYYRVPTHYTKSRNARRSSAEWIVEAPYSGGILPLAHFDTVNLAGCSATLNNHPGAISDSAWQHDSITMETSSGATKAQPSGLSSDGSGFSVTWSQE